jgi:hypothetical protein
MNKYGFTAEDKKKIHRKIYLKKGNKNRKIHLFCFYSIAALAILAVR